MLAISRSKLWVCTTAAAVGLLVAWLAAPVSAKQPPAKKAAPARGSKVKPFDEIPSGTPDPRDWKLKKTNLMAEGRFPEGPEGEADVKMFNNHYRLLVAEMTHWDLRDSVHLKRAEIKKDLNGFGRAPDKTIHTTLRDMMTKLLPVVINGPKYSPAARFNALLAYGELNAEEGDIGGNGCVPYPQALPTLVTVLKNKDGKYPAYLQPAALAGVTRHILTAKNSVTPEVRKDLVQTLASWLRSPPAEGLTPEVQNFTRRRASDLLRILARWPEANNADVVAALNQFAADEEAPLDDRCEAIRTLGVLDKKSFPDKSVPTVARTIALLVAEVGRQTPAPQAVAAPVAAEAEEGAATDAPADTPASPAEPADPAGNPPAAAEAPAVAAAAPEEGPAVKAQNVLPPDLQAYFLSCLLSGVSGPGAESTSRGLASAATADNKQLLTDVAGKINEMLNVVKRKKREDKLNEDEIRKLQDLATSVETLIGHKTADVDGAAEQARAQ